MWTICRLVDYFYYFTRQELLSQSTLIFSIVILLQSPSSIKMSSCIRNEMSLNEVRAIQNCFKGMRTDDALDANTSAHHNLLFVFRNSFDFSIWISRPSTNGIAKQLVALFIFRLQSPSLCWIVHWIGACFSSCVSIEVP